MAKPCECCTTATNTTPTARTIYKIRANGNLMQKVMEVIVAPLCAECRTHEVGECPKCWVEGKRGVFIWAHAWLAHTAANHPAVIERLLNTPETPAPKSKSRLLGRLHYGREIGL